jgi:hypothetical protein
LTSKLLSPSQREIYDHLNEVVTFVTFDQAMPRFIFRGCAVDADIIALSDKGLVGLSQSRHLQRLVTAAHAAILKPIADRSTDQSKDNVPANKASGQFESKQAWSLLPYIKYCLT